ncbi:Hypothetical Protein FCC1311_044872 [Hondaea fermentalgiana]|uniref:Uncharacterized protein n=1 Tax=Hondaea fermentalgiana TaxID=2315210 RepID=A0A2R5GK70_9STRA|nr:Hypothetical Protein FCC1311_044872 [Hondaea fermentalgiana]|eukprot:GBG28264.1 Hypothetical Protein FCC1311_044872 [Hondaea fermentalgiana]
MRTEDAFAASNTYISHEILVECANVFQEEESGMSLHAANDTSSEAQCPWPYRTRTYSAVADFAAVQGSNLDGSPASFFAACELPCPDQIVLTDRQDRMLWMAHWVPGLLSLPLNVFIISSGIARRRAARRIPRKPRYQLDATEMYMACLAVVIAVLDVSIALFLGYDVRCAGHDTVSRFESLGGHPFCKVALLNEHVLQVFVSCLAFALVKLCCQLRTPAQAHLLIDGPLLASAIVAASAYGWLFMTFRGLIQAIHSGHVKRPGAATQSRALLRLSLATSRFAFVALVCVVMSALSFELYRNVDSLDETPATILAHWETCAASNFQDNANTVSQLANAALPLIPKDSIRFCARVGEAMPRAPLLVAFVLARASPPLVFGVAFAKRALQQTRFRVFPRGLQSVRVAAVRATTSRIATSPTHAARRGAADDRPC